MKYLMSLVALLTLVLGCQTPELKTESPETLGLYSHVYLQSAERMARNSSVKVVSALTGGHGSGTLFRVANKTVVLTAKHVAREEHLPLHIQTPAGEVVEVDVIYREPEADIAVLMPRNTIITSEALSLRIKRLDPQYLVGMKSFYAGNPGHHTNVVIRGYFSGYEHGYLLMDTFAFFGASGSTVFGYGGKVVGILTAVDNYYGEVLENMVWITPISKLNRKELVKAINKR